MSPYTGALITQPRERARGVAFQPKDERKLPDISTAQADLEVRDRDAEQKGKSKIYADERRGAKYSDVDIGDTVLVKQEKTDKLTTPFNTTPHKVVGKAGSQVVVESPTSKIFKKHHMGKEIHQRS
ncbi:hypothetical protein AAFF_G00358260 [Aldrovandia affinis]|uniref:Uncharacterized protein n=1 Tax=Aldrovandia affinis TaxID=143900 RepID=A0AAD7TA07_9TELE|nr:hypothetical protein AAFF_G00358260 [Aldrovandia affinis]